MIKRHKDMTFTAVAVKNNIAIEAGFTATKGLVDQAAIDVGTRN
jgi:hypothetical protein